MLTKTHITNLQQAASCYGNAETVMAAVFDSYPVLGWGFTCSRTNTLPDLFILEPVPVEVLAQDPMNVFILPYAYKPRTSWEFDPFYDEEPAYSLLWDNGKFHDFSILEKVVPNGVFDEAAYDALTPQEQKEAQEQAVLWHTVHRRIFEDTTRHLPRTACTTFGEH